MAALLLELGRDEPLQLVSLIPALHLWSDGGEFGEGLISEAFPPDPDDRQTRRSAGGGIAGGG